MRPFIFITLLFVWFSAPASEIKVTFVVPDKHGGYFWQMVSDVSQAAAKSLGVDIEIIDSDPNRFASREIIAEITKRDTKPDYLIFRPFLGNTESVFAKLEAAKINFVTLEQAFPPELSEKIGKPNGRFKHWIGQVNYDNEHAGEIMLKAMIAKHSEFYPNSTMNITGIGGDFDSVSFDRQIALEERIADPPDDAVVVNQVIPISWDSTLVAERFPQILRRYPDTNSFWCAGDQIALEVIKELKKHKMENIIVGGFDWLPTALNAIANDELTVSAGGHYLMAAISLLIIVDYENGVDSIASGTRLHQMEVITRDNIDEFLAFFNNQGWKDVDFNRFLRSKYGDNAQLLTTENLVKLRNSDRLSQQ